MARVRQQGCRVGQKSGDDLNYDEANIEEGAYGKGAPEVGRSGMRIIAAMGPAWRVAVKLMLMMTRGHGTPSSTNSCEVNGLELVAA
jgi:hypothetical protein